MPPPDRPDVETPDQPAAGAERASNGEVEPLPGMSGEQLARDVGEHPAVAPRQRHRAADEPAGVTKNKPAEAENG